MVKKSGFKFFYDNNSHWFCIAFFILGIFVGILLWMFPYGGSPDVDFVNSTIEDVGYQFRKGDIITAEFTMKNDFQEPYYYSYIRIYNEEKYDFKINKFIFYADAPIVNIGGPVIEDDNKNSNYYPYYKTPRISTDGGLLIEWGTFPGNRYAEFLIQTTEEIGELDFYYESYY